MKLYIAFKSFETLMEGGSEEALGVFDSEAKAWEYLKTTSDFERSSILKDGKTRAYHFDGELSYFWYVTEVDLNRPLYETA